MNAERLIKRYTNRKLYDTLESRYVTLEEIARLVREGEEIAVIDNESSEDLTAVTFAQIILEEERRKTNLISVPFLRKLIRSGEARVQDLSDRASRGIEAVGEIAEKAGQKLRGVVDDSSKALEDGRGFVDDLLEIPQKRFRELGELAKKSVESVRSNPTIQRELERVATSLHSLERSVEGLREAGNEGEQEASSDLGETGSAVRYANGESSQGKHPAATESAETEKPVETEKPAGTKKPAGTESGGRPGESKAGV